MLKCSNSIEKYKGKDVIQWVCMEMYSGVIYK